MEAITNGEGMVRSTTSVRSTSIVHIPIHESKLMRQLRDRLLQRMHTGIEETNNYL